jgi:hypothetical protein
MTVAVTLGGPAALFLVPAWFPAAFAEFRLAIRRIDSASSR